MVGYIKGKGIYVGTFSESDVASGKDRLAVRKAMDDTGLEYTNTEFKRSSGKIVGLKIYVCRAEDFRLQKGDDIVWASSEERNSYAMALSSAKRQINELNMRLQGERLLYKNEIKRLTEMLSAKATDCHVGVWCEDCVHSGKAAAGEVIYCKKHLHKICPEFEIR